MTEPITPTPLAKTKEVTVKTLTGEDVVVVFRNTLSAWEAQYIEAAVIKYMIFDEESGKSTFNQDRSDEFTLERRNRRLVSTVISFGAKKDPTAREILSVLLDSEYQKLSVVVEEICDRNLMSDVKKKAIPENSSAPLAPNPPVVPAVLPSPKITQQ